MTFWEDVLEYSFYLKSDMTEIREVIGRIKCMKFTLIQGSSGVLFFLPLAHVWGLKHEEACYNQENNHWCGGETEPSVKLKLIYFPRAAHSAQVFCFSCTIAIWQWWHFIITIKEWRFLKSVYTVVLYLVLSGPWNKHHYRYKSFTRLVRFLSLRLEVTKAVKHVILVRKCKVVHL